MTNYRPMVTQWLTDAQEAQQLQEQQATADALAQANTQPSAPVIPGQGKQPPKPEGHSPELIRLLDHISAPHLRRF